MCGCVEGEGEGCTEGEGQEHLDVQKGRKLEGQRKERGEMCVCEQKVGGAGVNEGEGGDTWKEGKSNHCYLAL